MQEVLLYLRNVPSPSPSTHPQPFEASMSDIALRVRRVKQTPQQLEREKFKHPKTLANDCSFT